MQSPIRHAARGIAGIVLAAVVLTVAWWWSHPHQAVAKTRFDAAAALAALREGNERFVHSARLLSTDTRHDAEHRHETAQGQHPFAAILCCCDSRICPEFIFDQRFGTIFEIRNAGNVVDDDVMASMEYAVEHLHVPLVIVLGHKSCGAIAAVCQAGDHPLHDHLVELQKHMAAVRKDLHDHPGTLDSARLDALAKVNAREQAAILLRDCRVLAHAVERHEVKILYAMYDMESGAVEFFDFPVP